MKTGLFKESFLEDPWAELVNRNAGGGQVAGQESAGGEAEFGVEDSEGEIDLGEEFDGGKGASKDVDEIFGLGDGIGEAAQRIPN
jgi:hypothetical protein